MRDYLISFLKHLEMLAPPPPNCHHCLTFALYGSDVTGWEEKLALQLNRRGTFLCGFLEAEDFSHSPEELAEKVALHFDCDVPNQQIGVAVGQYTEE